MPSVLSKDGTKIGYASVGHGPGLILIQGALGTARNYSDLAAALASSFTVHCPDRRGRGMSPQSFSEDHCIQRDVDDVAALSGVTGASFLFGLSSGAVIALTSVLAYRRSKLRQCTSRLSTLERYRQSTGAPLPR